MCQHSGKFFLQVFSWVCSAIRWSKLQPYVCVYLIFKKHLNMSIHLQRCFTHVSEAFLAIFLTESGLKNCISSFNQYINLEMMLGDIQERNYCYCTCRHAPSHFTCIKIKCWYSIHRIICKLSTFFVCCWQIYCFLYPGKF